MIRFYLPHGADVTMHVYSVLGTYVATPFDEFRQAGHHTVVWEGTGSDGEPMPDGWYLCRLEIRRRNSIRRLLMTPHQVARSERDL